MGLVHHEEWSESSGLVRGCPQAQEDGQDLPCPSSSEFIELVEDAKLDGLKYHGVHTLDLAISSRVSDRILVDSDAIVIA